MARANADTKRLIEALDNKVGEMKSDSHNMMGQLTKQVVTTNSKVEDLGDRVETIQRRVDDVAQNMGKTRRSPPSLSVKTQEEVVIVQANSKCYTFTKSQQDDLKTFIRERTFEHEKADSMISALRDEYSLYTKARGRKPCNGNYFKYLMNSLEFKLAYHKKAVIHDKERVVQPGLVLLTAEEVKRQKKDVFPDLIVYLTDANSDCVLSTEERQKLLEAINKTAIDSAK